MIRIIAAAVLLLASVGFAQTSRPAGSVAQADNKLEQAHAAAEKIYRQSYRTALQRYVQELDAAKSLAMKHEDLDQAQAIVKKRQDALDLIKALSDDGDRKIVDVPANVEWTVAGQVKKGQRIEFTTSGKWRMSTNWPLLDGDGDPTSPNLPSRYRKATYGSLIGRIGDNLFKVGKTSTLVVDEDGELDLGPNDSIKDLADNVGSIKVGIQITGDPAELDAHK